MSEDLTDLAKLQMGRIEVARRPLKLAESVKAVCGLLQMSAGRLKILLKADVPDNLPVVQADAVHLERVLGNLVANALKFTPEGGNVRISAQAAPHHVLITVSDTGTGIAPQKLKTLFVKFIDGDADGTERSSLVTGLGLSICLELVEAHGGKIWAESEWRRGSQIHFTLPLGESPCSAGC